MKRLQHLSPLLLGIIVVLLSCIPLLDLLHPGLPITHDGQDHVARIANFYASLREGNIVPRWGAHLNWGYGHPILEFLYPLPSYVASFFHALGFSFVDSTKLVFVLAYILSLLTMYLWAGSVWGWGAGIVAAVLYGFAPYRFVDLYVRGAIGEHMAFVFPPLIAWGLWGLSKGYSKHTAIYFFVTGISTALLITAHNALSLMFLPVVMFYGFYLALSGIGKPLRYVIISFIAIAFGFSLSAFYWLPAFFEGKYTLRDIVTAGDFSSRFVPWLWFLYSPWNYGGGNDLSKWIGGGQLITLLVSASGLEKQATQRRLLVSFFILLVLTLFLMTSSALPIWQTVTLLQKFQFPWRFMSLTPFLVAVIGAIGVYTWQGKGKSFGMIILCILTIMLTFGQWRARTYKVYPETFFTGIYDSTTDTGESSPIWSIRFMEKRASAPAVLFPPSGTIRLIHETTTGKVYQVTVKQPVRFIENTLYFPGWTIRINGKYLPQDKLQFQDPTYRGLMTFDLDPGEYTIQFQYTNTKFRTIADRVSVASLLVFFLIIGTIYLWPKKK